MNNSIRFRANTPKHTNFIMMGAHEATRMIAQTDGAAVECGYAHQPSFVRCVFGGTGQHKRAAFGMEVQEESVLHVECIRPNWSNNVLNCCGSTSAAAAVRKRVHLNGIIGTSCTEVQVQDIGVYISPRRVGPRS